MSRLARLLRHLKLARVQSQLLRFPLKLLSPSNPGPPFHTIDGSSILSVLQAPKILESSRSLCPLKFRSTQETWADDPKRFLTDLSSAQWPELTGRPAHGPRLSPAGRPWPGAACPVHLPGSRPGAAAPAATLPAQPPRPTPRLRASTQDRLPPRPTAALRGHFLPRPPPATLSSASTARPASRHTPEA